MQNHFSRHWVKYVIVGSGVVVASVFYNAGQKAETTGTPPVAITQPHQVPAGDLTPINPIGIDGKGGCHSDGSTPDATCTPGIINPDITQANIGATICNSGWTTKSIRPPVSYTNPLKLKQITQYGYADTNPKSYEEDHLIALTDGGNPTDPRNLWPQAYVPADGPGAHAKDTVELYIHKQICSGAMTLAQGQDALARHWPDYIQKSGATNNFGSILSADPDDN